MNRSIELFCCVTLAVLCMALAQSAHADERLSPPGAAKLRLANLCMNAGTNPDCAASFAHALQSTDDTPDVVVTAVGTARASLPRGLQPLHFQKRAPWERRLETLSKEGIPFFRVPRGPERELIVGINRKGILGFELKQTRR